MKCTSFLLTAVFVFATTVANAHEPHESAKLALDYKRAVELHEWNDAVKFIEKRSLTNLKKFQIQYLRDAPTIGAEEKLLRLMGLTKINDLTTLSPEEIFVRKGMGNTNTLSDPIKYKADLKKTLKLKLIGTSMEDDSLVHAIIRTEYGQVDGATGQVAKVISKLDLVSLVKEGNAWKVSLDAHEPKVFRRKKK